MRLTFYQGGSNPSKEPASRYWGIAKLVSRLTLTQKILGSSPSSSARRSEIVERKTEKNFDCGKLPG